jgi:hypothetical protein
MEETRVKINFFVKKDNKQCDETKRIINELVTEIPYIEFKLEDIDIETDTITALAHQVYNAPSIAINGATKFHGIVPSKEELRKELEKERIF